ncbi:hypothetical protein DFJ73DRAFT_761032 [Zopfochytrium polystomum]|nr:hypothetical protein DFJ73DRAFT_761032 [Zopfochytrium polystomum]
MASTTTVASKTATSASRSGEGPYRPEETTSASVPYTPTGSTSTRPPTVPRPKAAQGKKKVGARSTPIKAAPASVEPFGGLSSQLDGPFAPQRYDLRFTKERIGVLSTPFKSTITDYLQTAFDEVPDPTPMAISPLPSKTPTAGAQVPTFACGLAGTYGSGNTQRTANPVATPTDPKPIDHTTPVFTNVASEKRFKSFFPSDEDDSPLRAKNPGVRFTVDSTLSAEETPAAARKAPAAHKINPRSTDDRHPDTVASHGPLASTQPAVATRLLKPEQQPTSAVPHMTILKRDPVAPRHRLSTDDTTAPPPLPPKQERTDDSGSDGDDGESDDTRPPNSPSGGDPFDAGPFSDPNGVPSVGYITLSIYLFAFTMHSPTPDAFGHGFLVMLPRLTDGTFPDCYEVSETSRIYQHLDHWTCALQPGSAGEDFLQHAAGFPPRPERRDQSLPLLTTPGSRFQFRLPPRRKIIPAPPVKDADVLPNPSVVASAERARRSLHSPSGLTDSPGRTSVLLSGPSHNSSDNGPREQTPAPLLRHSRGPSESSSRQSYRRRETAYSDTSDEPVPTTGLNPAFSKEEVKTYRMANALPILKATDMTKDVPEILSFRMSLINAHRSMVTDSVDDRGPSEGGVRKFHDLDITPLQVAERMSLLQATYNRRSVVTVATAVIVMTITTLVDYHLDALTLVKTSVRASSSSPLAPLAALMTVVQTLIVMTVVPNRRDERRPDEPTRARSSSRDRALMPCHRCKQTGHLRDDCPYAAEIDALIAKKYDPSLPTSFTDQPPDSTPVPLLFDFKKSSPNLHVYGLNWGFFNALNSLFAELGAQHISRIGSDAFFTHLKEYEKNKVVFEQIFCSTFEHTSHFVWVFVKPLSKELRAFVSSKSEYKRVHGHVICVRSVTPPLPHITPTVARTLRMQQLARPSPFKVHLAPTPPPKELVSPTTSGAFSDADEPASPVPDTLESSSQSTPSLFDPPGGSAASATEPNSRVEED